jgi:thiamine-monophosphate kinase
LFNKNLGEHCLGRRIAPELGLGRHGSTAAAPARRTVARMKKGEISFINELRRRLQDRGWQSRAGEIAIGDDMAALNVESGRVLVSTDMLSDGVDFDSHVHDWRDIGRKSMAVNLSDCAAMAVRPRACVAAVTLNKSLSMQNALDLADGIARRAADFDCPLIGGDTNSFDGPTTIAVTILAEPDGDRPPLRRDTARPGDIVCVTGPVGGSILGRHLDPAPRVHEAIEINRTLGPHAAIDISDGLVLDLWRVADASGCGAELDEHLLLAAIHQDATALSEKDGIPPLEHALYDGEDFELIVVLPASLPEDAGRAAGLLPIGRCRETTGIRLMRADGSVQALDIRGWEHFT